MDRETFSMREVALCLLSLIDTPENVDLSEMGIDDHEYIGQGAYKLYVDRDALMRVAGLLDDGGY
jgi:hypothetical protein